MQKHIEHLRSLYSKYAIDAYVIPSSDEFQNEYPPQKLNRLLWITGFSYSNGVLIISKDTNIFFTDARYLLQAKEEIGKYCEILDMYKPGACKIIGDVLNGGSLGYDTMLHTIDNLKYYETLASRYNFSMKRIDTNLVDIIRCAGSNENIQENSDITVFGIEYAGEYKEERQGAKYGGSSTDGVGGHPYPSAEAEVELGRTCGTSRERPMGQGNHRVDTLRQQERKRPTTKKMGGLAEGQRWTWMDADGQGQGEMGGALEAPQAGDGGLHFPTGVGRHGKMKDHYPINPLTVRGLDRFFP